MKEFKEFYLMQLLTYDCDSPLYVMRYLIDRFELNVEQQHWLCWLYANTYQIPTAWVIFNEFPDFENVCPDGLDMWCRLHKDRLPYQKDQKWLRGRLGETFLSYRKEVGHRSQCGYWGGMDGSFNEAWNTINKRFHRFGRYTAWFYLQALNEICGHEFEPEHMFLKDDSSKQPRLGLQLATGLEDINGLNAAAQELLESMPESLKVRGNLPVRANLFSMETSLCAYSKMGRGAPKGRYLGYYLDRMAEDITKTSGMDWRGINWDTLWEARDEMLLPYLNHRQVRKEEMEAYPMLGVFTTDPELSQLLQDLIEMA
jgi:hypothetical protein